MEQILETAAANQRRAHEIIDELRILEVWNSAGAEAHLVGSLRTGLLMKHKDIDFHVYSLPVSVADSFAAISQFAANRHIVKADFVNLMDTREECLEWHLYYRGDTLDDLWQIDMIHIAKGSLYDGYFEKVADRISAAMTSETKNAILKLKYETPEETKIMGIEYCRAVMEGGVRTYRELTEWRKLNPVTGIVEWMP